MGLAGINMITRRNIVGYGIMSAHVVPQAKEGKTIKLDRNG
jgi:hypothetical protein